MKKFWDFIDERKIVRRFLVAWAAWLITWVTMKLFTDITVITAAAVTAYGTAVGILATAIGFYKWTRQKEDKEITDLKLHSSEKDIKSYETRKEE